MNGVVERRLLGGVGFAGRLGLGDLATGVGTAERASVVRLDRFLALRAGRKAHLAEGKVGGAAALVRTGAAMSWKTHSQYTLNRGLSVAESGASRKGPGGTDRGHAVSWLKIKKNRA